MKVQETDITDQLRSLFMKCDNSQLEAAKNYILESHINRDPFDKVLIQIEERRR